MNLRLMQMSDHPQLVQLWQAENMISSLDYLERILARNPETCWVLEVEGQIVAAACGLYDGRRGILQSVAVLPAERGKGYGKKVVLAVVDSLRQFEGVRIRLFVESHNQGALLFYQKLGFQLYENVIYMAL